jgi:internalin A
MRAVRRLLAIIRSDFDRLHNNFKFKPEELVPIPGYPNKPISYRELLDREKKGRISKEIYLESGDFLTLNVIDLLNGVDLEGSRQSKSIFRPLQRCSAAVLQLFPQRRNPAG